MKKAQYRKLMLETIVKVGDLILEYLEPLKKENEEIYNLVSELLKKKIGTFETRAYLMRMSYEICSGKKWKTEIIHACVAIELELASMYYANRIFDDKGGRKILSQPNKQFIAAMITRDLASQALTKACSKTDYKTFVKIKDIFDEINKIFYIGQYYEISYNLYNRKTKLDFDRLIEYYYRRNYGVNNSFFEKIALLGAILGKGTEEQIKALSSFGKNYGMAIQIVNDIADFVPKRLNLGTEEKLPKDAFSDLKHKKMTLPIIYTLAKEGEDRKKVINILEKENPSEKELIELTKMFLNNGAIDFSKKTALDFIDEGKRFLKIFPKEKRAPLSTMKVVINSNRYYKSLQKLLK